MEDQTENGTRFRVLTLIDEHTRVVLKLHPQLAPIKVAVFPLKKNEPPIVELAKRIKRDLQPVLRAFSRRNGKRLLAEAPDKVLPPSVIDRRKTGFGIPLGRWLPPESNSHAVAWDSRNWAKRIVEAYEKRCA